MPILDEFVEIVVNGQCHKYYEDLGYVLPKHKSSGKMRYTGEPIKVKPEHLPKYSSEKVTRQCDDCGEVSQIRWNSLQRSLKTNNLKKPGETLCKVCAGKRYSGNCKAPGWKHGRQDYGYYKSQARQRKKEWKLSIEEFDSLIPGVCYLCGKESTGIDRVDNELPYEISNCKPCCKTCNYMKQSMKLEDFIEHISDILSHSSKY